MVEKTCATCRFWTPTEAGGQFGGDAIVGQCSPAGSDDTWLPEVFTWPAAALSWDGDGPGDAGAILLTNASFGCIAWSARGEDHEQ